jgi:hypothetical protein
MFVASMICAVETLPFVIVICATRGWEPKAISYLIASSFTVLAVVLSIREICKHLLNYHKPHLQIHIIRVLWMVPIYAIDACLSLTLPASKEAYPQAVRELYEAYTIWSFMKFLTLYLEESALEKEKEGHNLEVVVEQNEDDGIAVPTAVQDVLDNTLAAFDPAKQMVMGVVDNVRKEVQDVLESVPLANESLKLANQSIKQVAHNLHHRHIAYGNVHLSTHESLDLLQISRPSECINVASLRPSRVCRSGYCPMPRA